jgi:hypothetical protein
VGPKSAIAWCDGDTYEDTNVKLISTLTLASLLVAGSAFAADAPASMAKPVTAATKAAPDHHCRDNANEKKLAGAARKSYIKKCLADARAAK